MTTSTENEEIVQRVSYGTYSGDEDLDVIDELVSEEFVLHDPLALAGEELRGRDGLREHVETARTLFPDFEATIERMVAVDDTVAVHFTGRGTHEGEIPDLDIEPTGDVVEFEGMEFDRIEDGMLAESWLVIDSLSFLGQLGAIPTEELPA